MDIALSPWARLPRCYTEGPVETPPPQKKSENLDILYTLSVALKQYQKSRWSCLCMMNAVLDLVLSRQFDKE